MRIDQTLDDKTARAIEVEAALHNAARQTALTPEEFLTLTVGEHLAAINQQNARRTIAAIVAQLESKTLEEIEQIAEALAPFGIIIPGFEAQAIPRREAGTKLA